MHALVVSTLPWQGYQVCASLALAGVRADLVGDRAWTMARVSRACARHTHLPRAELCEGSDRALRHIEYECRTRGIDIVIPSDLRAARMLAHKGDALGGATLHPMPDVELLDRLRDEWHTAQLLEELALPHPKTWLIKSPEELCELGDDFPVIVKPATGEARENLLRIDDAATLETYVGEYLGDDEAVLVQHFVPGIDVNLSFLADRGELVAHSLETRRSASVVDFLRDDRATEVATNIARATRYHGVANIGMRANERDGSLSVIDLRPGYWDTLLYASWSGVNYPWLGALLATGGDPRPHFEPRQGPCTHFGVAPGMHLATWLRGRGVPHGLTSSSEAAWQMNQRDPLPMLWQRGEAALQKVHRRRR